MRPNLYGEYSCMEQQTILSFPSGLNKVTFEVLFFLKETVLQLASYNY